MANISIDTAVVRARATSRLQNPGVEIETLLLNLCDEVDRLRAVDPQSGDSATLRRVMRENLEPPPDRRAFLNTVAVMIQEPVAQWAPYLGHIRDIVDKNQNDPPDGAADGSFTDEQWGAARRALFHFENTFSTYNDGLVSLKESR
jgi:hypothetical protein